LVVDAFSCKPYGDRRSNREADCLAWCENAMGRDDWREWFRARGAGTAVCAGRNHLCYNFCRFSSTEIRRNGAGRAEGVLTNMSSTKSKLRLVGAFAALATLALAVGCRGFFPATTYSALTIQPTPQVPLGSTQGLQLWGTISGSTGTRQISSGASWTITTGTTGAATITNTGVATGKAPGSITVNATYQGLTTSATGVVYIADITSICVSGTNTSATCSASTETISASGGGGTVPLYAIAGYTNANNQSEIQDITTSATWTVSGPDTTTVTCTTTTSPAQCQVLSGGTTGNYIITVSYPQTAITAMNTIKVN